MENQKLKSNIRRPGSKMPQLRILVMAVLIVSTQRSDAFPRGAPPNVCDSLAPAVGPHGQPQDNSTNPYKLIVKEQIVPAGGVVSLEIVKIDQTSPDFKGFIVNARDTADGKIVGKFQASGAASQTICDGGTATHTSREAKKSLALEWTAPTALKSASTVDFTVTVLQSQRIYWLKHSGSTLLEVQPTSAEIVEPVPSTKPEPTPEPEPSPEPEPEPEPTPESEPESTPEPSSGKASAYDPCGKSKGCFGYPESCYAKGGCTVGVLYSLNEKGQAEVELRGEKLPGGKYLAVGLSEDASMGGDVVFSCSSSGPGIQVSWNQGKSNNAGVENITIKDAEVKTIDGSTRCRFKMPEKFTISPPGGRPGQQFDLRSTKYHLLVATGNQGAKLSYHNSKKLASAESVDFASAAGARGAGSDYLIQIHGLLMALAWLACASTGTVVARYYKETWREVRPAGKDLWFRLHQVTMASAVLMTTVAFVVILVKVGFFPYNSDFFVEQSAHPVVGALCILFAFVQPIMAWFRPSPDSGKRWIFNWGHWFCGNAAFLLAVCSVFLAVDLKAASLNHSVTHAMMAYVIVHAVVHLVLTGQRINVKRKEKNVHDVAFSHGHPPSGDLSGSKFRKVVLAIYIIFVWAVTIAVVVFIFKSIVQTPTL